MIGPVRQAQALGQSIWYDNLSRRLIASGELDAMVAEGLTGITSNPSTFEKAIGGTKDYDESLRELVGALAGDTLGIYERLATEDIRRAADILRPVYDSSKGRDGYVSWEVSPHLAHDTDATVAEARRLFRLVGRQNTMIKIPGTPEGIPALTELIAEGININVTLLFSLDAYRATVDAYIAGIRALLRAGRDPRGVQSVASFFLSRIDTAVDDAIAAALSLNSDPQRRSKLESLRGKVALANAKLAYARYQSVFGKASWKSLANQGAHSQRVLWASTGTKNPLYPSLMYVEELVGPDTINTMPAQTYQEFRKHGRVRPSLTEGMGQAAETLRTLSEVGLSMDAITFFLLKQGVELFKKAFDGLLAAVEQKRQSIHDWRANKEVR